MAGSNYQKSWPKDMEATICRVMSKITELITNNPYRILRIFRNNNVPKAFNKLQKQLRNNSVPDALFPNLGKLELIEADIIQAKSLIDKEGDFYANYWFDSFEDEKYLVLEKLFAPNPNLQELKTEFAKLDSKWHPFFDEILQKYKEKSVKPSAKKVAPNIESEQNTKASYGIEKNWLVVLIAGLLACFTLWLIFMGIRSQNYKSTSSTSFSSNSLISSNKFSSSSSGVSSVAIAVPVGTNYYKGTIDGNLPIIAKLTVASDKSVIGEYIYRNCLQLTQ